MPDRTGHAAAPWVLVEAEDKRRARGKVVESVVAAIEAAWPPGTCQSRSGFYPERSRCTPFRPP